MARLAEHEKLLGKLIAETEPNGGNSLRDVWRAPRRRRWHQR